ncbi:major capsid protein [Salmonella enterica]|uniref:major capsid protein n=1 Tax=Salmonella enterica TaxID=28901 RepID=UPI0009AE8A2B|nr:major capsid protein [Salmonella enterica]
MSRFGRKVPSNSQSQHNFSVIPSANIQRSVFNRSSGYKTTFDAGLLIPVFLDEALPGDTFHLKTSILARLSTPVVPFMDNLRLDIQYFSVPFRLVWDNWQRFNGEQKNPGDSTDYLIPQIKAPAGGFPVGSIADYFGVPTGISGISVSALPFRAYNLIYNEWYRDENLVNSAPVPVGDETETGLDNFPLRRRAKRHDYFTSALPWPQKGEGVEIGLGVPPTYSLEFPEYNTGLPVKYSFLGGSTLGGYIAAGQPVQVESKDTMKSALFFSDGRNSNTNTYLPATNVESLSLPKAALSGFSSVEPPVRLVSQGGEIIDNLTINSLRQAFQLQRLLERDARGGTRYIEIIRSHFGVISPDARVQRPEYLGSGSFDININPVLQNSATTEITPQGNLAAYGVSGGVNRGFSHSFVEHCFVIGLVSVRADLTYQQGIPRMFSRQTRFDYYWPSLAHLGEQAILNKEIYAQGNEKDDEVFGYQERYAEYRYRPSQITGKLRSTDPQSLDVWHLAQRFDSLPALNQEFIEERPPMSRVLAVQDEPQFIMDAFFDLRCVRPMPVYSVPGLIDHF